MDAPTQRPATRDRARETFRDFLRAHRRVLLLLLGAIAATIFVLAVLPQIAGFGHTLNRLREGDKRWLVAGVAFEMLSIGGYVAISRAVFSCDGVRIGWKESYQITMAGIVATKIFSTAGAGGVALTAWALRARGLSARAVARRMTAFEVLLYAVFMGALVIVGVGLATGVLPGTGPRWVTVMPAAFGGAVIAVALASRLLLDRVAGWLRRLGRRRRRARGLLERVSSVPQTLHDGIGTAMELVRTRDPWLLGAVGYWAFDIAALWAAFRAFGGAPPIAVVVMAYFVGQLGNVLPIPGGVGGVEGAMIGAFLAFGVNGSTAVLAVLTYRAISFWLPTLPGAIAYFQLRRTVSRWRETSEAEGRRRPNALTSMTTSPATGSGSGSSR